MPTELLKLIETVSPDDTATLDEIDARYWCLKNGCQYVGIVDKTRLCHYVQHGVGCYQMLPKVSRSLDAVSAEMPEGDCIVRIDVGGVYVSWIDRETILGYKSPILPTEALARLHVTIQAKMGER